MRGWTLGAAAVGLALAAGSGAQAQGARFDGAWMVTLACPATTPGRAMAFSFQFPAQVAHGLLHGERGTRGEPGWLTLDGQIAPDGSAALVAQGLTGVRGYALYDVSKGTPYRHPVQARFTATSGKGSWTTVRICTFDFRR